MNENGHPASEWDIYLLAGIGSTPSLFNECKRELRRRFRESGRDPVIRELFPYGDHTHKIWRQVLEVGADLARLRGSWRSGGSEAAAEVRELSRGNPVLFIGHSGGCVAAYHAAVRLMNEKFVPDFRLVQVGSPKVPIRPEYRSKVSYFTAVDENGKRRDPITLLGSWSGWSRGRSGMWYWDKRKYAPGHVGQIMMLGGHEHYFRNDDAYVHPDRGSNLSMTLNSIWDRVAKEAVRLT
jgi:predicted alpha/beta hydrolase family esterase